MDLMEKLTALCKRRGFVFPGSELYGGLNGTWDLGPLGVALSNNIKKEWWKTVVQMREDVVGLDSSIIHHPKVWEASGHLSSFTDPLVECKVCHQRFREDHKREIEEHEKTHEEKNIWTDVKHFNLMFKTFVGPVEDDAGKAYLRPETAQGIFINYKNVLSSTRVKVPFGIAQIGKGFRNEITTGNFLFRVREFEMMELEYFVNPKESNKWFDYWRGERLNWFLKLGIKKENIKLVDLPKEEIAHYSKGTSEVHYNWPFMGFGELEGIANRGDYDLSKHSEYSGQDLKYKDEESGDEFVPYVIEPSVGVGRAILAFLLDAYSKDGERTVLKLNPKLAPFKAAVFPLLSNKKDLVEKAESIYKSLKEKLDGEVAWDARGNIGKRYFSQDEAGTPFCVTIDFETLENDTVTLRERDSAKQERVKVEDLAGKISTSLN